MKYYSYKRFISIAAISFIISLTVNTLTPEHIYARPGGGHSYSNSSSSNSTNNSSSNSSNNSSSNDSNYSNDDVDSDNLSGGYSSDYEPASLPEAIFSVIFMFAVLSAFSLAFTYFQNLGKRRKISSTTLKNIGVKALKTEKAISKLKELDPNFSTTLFLDFAASIFTKYHALQGKSDFKNLSPYLTPDEIRTYNKRKIKNEISEIVIGSMNITTIYPEKTLVSVDISANYTVVQKGKRTRYDVVERWRFKRNPNLLSPEPEKMRELSCPSCGVSVAFTDTGTCESCATLVKNGEMQWYVSTHNKLHQRVFETSGLAHYEKEQGTQLPTIYNSKNENIINQFSDIHNINTDKWLSEFENEIATVYFTKIYDAWSVNKLSKVRHLLSDRLFDSYLFWIAAYKAEGLTNKLDDLKIKKVKLAKIELDKFYESVTVRVFASCKDYVTNNQGKVIGGSNKKSRKFSEYWTFIRRTGVETNSYDYGTCPNCGAAADKMGQSGICEYCTTKISNGDFSWILAVVTQDEVYKG